MGVIRMTGSPPVTGEEGEGGKSFVLGLAVS